MSKSIEEKYKVLDEIDHVLRRSGMYIGSITDHTAKEWVYDIEDNRMVQEKITYKPGFCKVFSEILDNSIDESKREHATVDTIKVVIDRDTNKISVWDNGGIPVVIHKDENEYVPSMIFSKLRAGSNFNDDEDQSLIGTNGVGSALCNILSKTFKVETCDSKKKFLQVWKNNMRKVEEPSITNVGLHYTKITYEPDMDFFGMETITDGCYKKIIKRIVDCAGCNPRINFYINGKKLNIKSFDDYCKLFAADVILDRQDNWTVGIAAGTNGFKQMSFVNSVETYDGGNHVTLVTEQLILELKSHFKKKHKIDVKPADIRNHLMVFISCDLNRPQFDSQTKSKLITEQSNFSSKWVVPQKVINKILKSDIIQDVLDWVTAKEQMANMAKLRKLNKSNGKSTKSIVKFSDATSKTKRDKCMLFLAEGDSAAAAIKSARDSSIMGSYPLKGKPVNVRGMDLKKLIENKEFKELMAITGLQIGVKVKSPSDLRFGKIVIATDADLDGNHIIGLLINMLHHFWLELFELGMVYRFITPIVKVTQNKKVTSFYSSPEFEEWKDNNGAKKYTSKFYKGLGTSTSSDFKEYMSNLDKHLVPLTIEDDKDVDAIDLAFNSKRANDRKDWLNI